MERELFVIRMIEINGAHEEGGGQIIRTAIGLSALTRKPCHIVNIRAGRPKPGLMAQHLTGVQAVAELCDAKVDGAKLWSTELTFNPGKIKSGHISFDIGTAGAISLVLQSLTIPAVEAPGKLFIDIKGGTDVTWSPSMTYFRNIFCYWLQKMGVEIETRIAKYGFYPTGGGSAHIEITPPERLAPLNVTKRGKLESIHIISAASDQLKAANVAERQLEAAAGIMTALPAAVNATIAREHMYVPALSPGSSLQLYAQFEHCRLGAGAIGERSKRAEQIGQEAATLLKKQIESNACIDRWAADQLLPFIALASGQGPSEFSVAEITNHAATNAAIIEQFLPVRFEIIGERGNPGIIKCAKK